MVKRFLTALLMVLPLAMNAQNAKLGHIDVQALFFTLPDVKEVETKLKEVQTQYEEEMKRMQEEFTRKYSQFQQDYDKLDETIKKMRTEELETLKGKMDAYYQTAQSSLQQKQEELQAPIREKILGAIKSVADENGFTYVFDTGALLYKSDSATDLTELVQKKLGVSPASAPAKK